MVGSAQVAPSLLSQESWAWGLVGSLGSLTCPGSAFLPLTAAALAVASWIPLRKLGAMSGPGLAALPRSSDEKLPQPGRVSELLHSGACLC